MNADEMKTILKNEYGISDLKELRKAIEESPGVDIGLFTIPYKEVEKNVRNMPSKPMHARVSERT